MTSEVKERIAQIQRGEVPEGYKKGKLGIVPLEWKDTPFSTLFASTSDYTDDLEHYPLYSLTIENGITAKTVRYERSHLVKKENSYKIVRPNDYAYNPMNIRFGAVARHKGSIPVAVSGYYDIFTTVNDSDLAFMDSFLTCGPMITYYNKVSTGSLIEKQRVHFSQFIEFSLPFPSAEERQKIAELLTTQDKVIELKEKLIAEKQRQKKYLMQQLLTGKMRLPGFSGEWHTRKFSDIFSFLPTNTLSRADMCDDTGLVMNVHYGDVLIKYAEVLRVKQNKIPYIVEGKEPAKCVYLQNGDIVIADTAEDMTVGKATEVQGITCEKIVSGLHTMCVRPKNSVFAPEWLGFYINSTEFHGQLMRLACGSKVSSISKNTIKDTILNVPTITEQTAIADILSTADREIELLQQELEQEKQKKKALMQLLLTGIVRV